MSRDGWFMLLMAGDYLFALAVVYLLDWWGTRRAGR